LIVTRNSSNSQFCLLSNVQLQLTRTYSLFNLIVILYRMYVWVYRYCLLQQIAL